MMIFATLSPRTLLLIGAAFGFVLGAFFAAIVLTHKRHIEQRNEDL